MVNLKGPNLKKGTTATASTIGFTRVLGTGNNNIDTLSLATSGSKNKRPPLN